MRPVRRSGSRSRVSPIGSPGSIWTAMSAGGRQDRHDVRRQRRSLEVQAEPPGRKASGGDRRRTHGTHDSVPRFHRYQCPLRRANRPRRPRPSSPTSARPDEDRVDRLDAAGPHLPEPMPIVVQARAKASAIGRARRRTGSPFETFSSSDDGSCGPLSRGSLGRPGIGWAKSSVARRHHPGQGLERRARIMRRMTATDDSLEEAVRTLLEEIGEDPAREGLRALRSACGGCTTAATAGYHVDPDG